MAYKALYRIYRPQRFDEVIGQDVIIKTLQNALASGKITHAYLFSGPRGVGKTTVARLLAKAINCEHGMEKEPCNECESCRQIMEGINPDVIEIDAASNNGVDEIREIREKVKFLPGESKYKIYIIDEVHMLTTSAFNALLKTLEEPPKHVIFILATTEPQKVIPTILSRCQRYDFKGLSVDEVSRHIRNISHKEEVEITDEAINAIAESAEGGMRDALSILDQAIALSDDEITVDVVNGVTGNLSYNKLIELASFLEQKSISQALKTINELINLGKEPSKIVSGLLQFYRDVLLYKNVNTDEYSKYIFEKESFKQLANNITDKKIFYYVDVLSDAQSKIRSSQTPQIFLEVSVIKMVNVSQNDLDMLAHIKELEEKVDNIEIPEYTKSAPDSETLEKIAQLEEKTNRIVSELGKMDIPGLISRVNEIEGSSSNSSNKESSKEIDKLKEEVYLLKANYSSIANYQDIIDELQNKNSDGILLERIEKLEKEIAKGNELETNYDEINELIDDRLRNARREVSMDYEKINEIVEERVKRIEAVKGNGPSSVIDNILARLDKVENDTFKAMSGVLAKEPIPQKPKKKGPNENQLVLFGNDMVALDKIEKKSLKENVDFENFTKEDAPKKEEVKPQVKEEIKEEIKPIVFEKKVIDENDLRDESHKEINVFGSSKYSEDSPAERTLKRSGEFLSRGEEKSESKINIFGVSRYDGESPAEKNLNQSVNKLSDVPIDDKYERIDPIIARDAPRFSDEEELDEFERFDISVIERILNESRTPDARSDKDRIASLWPHLVEKTPEERKSVSEVLQEGFVSVVGNKEFIIVYDSLSVCNQVMKRKFKRDSLKILFDLLGATYNYMALPSSVWEEKRNEYKNQYNIGNVRNIKLRPINEAMLKILINAEEKTPEEEMLSKAKGLFGDKIIEVKD